LDDQVIVSDDFDFYGDLHEQKKAKEANLAEEAEALK
jgi:hypothetical protein